MQENSQDSREYYSGEIINVTNNQDFESDGLTSSKDPNHKNNFDIKILDGVDAGQTITVWSNGYNYGVGDKVYIEKYTQPGETPYYFLNEKIRTPEIFLSVLLFCTVVVVLFGWKGLKSLLSLVVSLLIIVFILLPLTLKGYNPVLLSSFISVLLLSTMIFITNGKNQVSISAIIGCISAIFITIILSYLAVEFTSISGKSDEVWTYIDYVNSEYVNFSLIVISTMIIGVIGAVDDGAITQASVVQELKSANPNLGIYEYYKRAMRVGRDHAGA